MAVDWMNVPVNFPMKGATISLDKRIEEALTLILARLSIQPEDTDFDTGVFTFPAVSDNVQRKTMALSEFTKLGNSELGYIYVRQDGTLVAENMLARNGWRALDQVWIAPDVNHFLTLEDGLGFLLLETGGKIILDQGEYEDAAISSDAEGYNILLAEDGLLNASIIRAHPVITDTSLKVLYTLGTPLFIPSQETRQFSAHYTDPSGLSQVSGTNMQDPVATTDYLANTASDGSGTNKTSDVIVDADYYGDTVYYSIENNSTSGVYITFLQARGYGIYYANSIESTVEDAASQAAHGYAPFQFDMKYQKDTYLADMYGSSVIEEYKNPKSRITSMRYLANLNKNHMLTFLTLTVGSLLLGTEDRSNISNNYYITDRAFTIKQGGIINVEYGVKQNDSYLSGGLKPVAVEFSGVIPSEDGIYFDYLPHVTNLMKKSVSAWIYIYDYSAFSRLSIMGNRCGSGGWNIFIPGAASGRLWYTSLYSGDDGIWYYNAALSENALHLVTITHDTTTPTNPPVIYVDGVSVAVTTYQAPTGAVVEEDGARLVIGNTLDQFPLQSLPFNGKIFDPRVYNRILTAAEVTSLYNAGVPDETLVTDGLVFQGLSVYSDRGDATSLAGTVLSSDDRLIENIIRVVGVPHGAPVIRANP